MRFPIQFNIALKQSGYTAEERKAIRNNIANNMQSYRDIQGRLQSFEVQLPNVFKGTTDFRDILNVNYEINYYKQHGYTRYEYNQYMQVIDDLNTIGVHGVTPDIMSKMTIQDYNDLVQLLGETMEYVDIMMKTGDISMKDRIDIRRERIIRILSRYT